MIIGCTGNREPMIPQENSGVKQSQEWLDYNKYATQNKKPILDFVATSLKKPPKNGKTLNYDNFKTDDNKVLVVTKWHNVKKDDLLEIKIYQPDGRLSHYGKQNYGFNSNKWVTWNNMKIKDSYASKNIGTWRADIFINDEKVVSKSFNIGSAKDVSPLKTNKTVGVFPYYDSEMSKYKFGYGTPTYLSKGILYHNKNVKIIPNMLILKDLVVPNTSYMDFDNYIQKDLDSDNSTIISIAKKHNMDYAVLGKVEATANSTLEMTFVTFIIDVSNKKIITKKEVKHDVRPTSMKAGQAYWDKIYADVFEQVLQSILPTVNNF